jgi:tetratricopeptide (TPR) repeat protein
MSVSTMKVFLRYSMISLFVLTVSACSGSKEEAASRYLNNGIELFDEGELSKASVELRNALQIDPKLANAYYYLALISEKNKNWKALFKNLSKVEKLDANHVQAKVKLGYLMLLAKQADTALEKADFILALDKDNAQAYAIKASAYLQKELYDVAMEYIDKAIEQDSDSAEIASIKVSIMHKQGDTDGALATLANIIDREKDSLHLLLLRTEINQEINDVAAMEADYRTLIRNNPEEKGFYLKLAQLLHDSDRIDAASEVLKNYLKRDENDTQVRIAIIEILTRQDESAGEDLLNKYIAKDGNNAELRFYRIDRMMAAGDQARALVELEEISTGSFQDPDLFRARSLKADLKLGAGDHDQALQLVNQILQADSNFEHALLVRARYHLIAEDIDAAVSDLRTVLRNNPESESALVMLANAYLSSGSDHLADDTFRKVLDINPGNVQAAVPVIQSLLEKKDVDRSERLIENALQRAPDNDILLSILAQIKLSKQDFEGTSEVVSLIEKNGKNPAFSSYLSGKTLQSQGQYKGAIEEYRQALKANPDLGRALEGLTVSYMRLDQQKQLLEYLKEFKATNPKNMMVLSILSSMHTQRGDHKAAIDVLEQGLVEDPGWVQGYTALASNYRAKNDYQAAIDSYERGLKVLPNSGLIKMLLASSYEKSGNKAKALTLYEQVLVTNPDHQVVANNLASLLIDDFETTENIKRAVKLAEQFADSENPYFVDTYAWALIKSGLPEVAGPLLQKATKMAPKVAIFHYHRGIGYARSGKPKEAKISLLAAREKAGPNDSLQSSITDALEDL